MRNEFAKISKNRRKQKCPTNVNRIEPGDDMFVQIACPQCERLLKTLAKYQNKNKEREKAKNGHKQHKILLMNTIDLLLITFVTI